MKKFDITLLKPWRRTAKPTTQLPFTEEQIRAKAYEIWRSRGTGTPSAPEADWNQAIQALKAERAPIRRLWNWTGFGEKKGWDFLQLLVVPLTLATVGIGFQEFTKQREQQLADDKAKQETLNKYLDQMAELLEKGLLKEKLGSEKFVIAQSKTAIALQSLDPSRQHLVIQFLEAAKLNALDKKGLLYRVRMSKANLAKGDLSGADFSGADFSGANLRGADLTGVNFSGANLRGADLRGADLRGFIFFSTRFPDEDIIFKTIIFKSVNFSGADLRVADLRGANLRGADLRVADLRGANLRGADLTFADLTFADLTFADLTFADLRGAQNLTVPQVKEARNWKQATYDANFRKQLGI